MASRRIPNSNQDHSIWLADGSKSGVELTREYLGEARPIRVFRKLSELKQAFQEPKSPLLLATDSEFSDGNLLDFAQEHPLTAFPFVIISAKPNAETIRKCFEVGAQDVFIKPFHPELLRIKVERLIQLHLAKAESMLLLELDFFSLTVRLKQLKAKLTLTEFHILLVLKESYPEGVSREVLHGRIWKGTKVVSKTLDVHIFKLRRKIEPLALRIEFGADRRFSIRQL